MGRKPRVDRCPEEKRQIVREGIKSGNVSETCRRHGIAPNLFYRWKDEAEHGAKAALLGEKCCRGGNREGPSHPAVGSLPGAKNGAAIPLPNRTKKCRVSARSKMSGMPPAGQTRNYFLGFL